LGPLGRGKGFAVSAPSDEDFNLHLWRGDAGRPTHVEAAINLGVDMAQILVHFAVDGVFIDVYSPVEEDRRYWEFAISERDPRLIVHSDRPNMWWLP
jgi:hypothetical protein